jgi:hypothetical protein
MCPAIMWARVGGGVAALGARHEDSKRPPDGGRRSVAGCVTQHLELCLQGAGDGIRQANDLVGDALSIEVI